MNTLTYDDVLTLPLPLKQQLAGWLNVDSFKNPIVYPDMEFLDWTCSVRWLRGKKGLRPFSLANHEYLREPMTVHHPYMVFEKGAQMALTEFSISKCSYLVDTLPRFRVIYFFPTDVHVQDFSKERFDGAVLDSPYLRGRSRGLKNVHVKRLGQGVIYFRGMESKTSTKSVPADMVVFDELDESNPLNKAQAKERLSHSDYKYVIELSTPTIPKRGIDIEWLQSDMRFLHIACGCREGIVLEKTFPDCIGVAKDGTAYLRCPKCGKDHLDPEIPAVIGEYRGWVPDRPEVKDRRGYHIPQLLSKYISTSEIWYDYLHTPDIAEFHNSKLGLPFAGDRMPLTEEIIEKASGDKGCVLEARKAYIGVDIGAHEWYVWVNSKDPNTGRRRLIYAEVIQAKEHNLKPWERLYWICDHFERFTLVIDAQPERSRSREVCRHYPGKAFMCFYSENQKQKIVVGDDNDPEDGEWKVVAHRTETLDVLVQAVQDTVAGKPGGLVFLHPRVPVMSEVKLHLSSLAKVRKSQSITAETGRLPIGYSEYVYIESGADHLAHAANYAIIAETCEQPEAFLGFLG